jgi:Sortase domain
LSLVKKGRHGRSALAVLAVALSAVGVILVTVGLRAQKHAPEPPASVAGPYAASSLASHPPPSHASTPVPAETKPKGLVLRGSTPTHLSIPAIGVNASLLNLGLNSDDTVQVPPLSDVAKAGWYRYSPSPGELGPSIILGHIDSARSGPGVFFKLGALRKGNTVSVRRADNGVAVFRVDAVAKYPKNHFPTSTVYGNTDHAALRLITCGGKFNSSTHHYVDNIVAYASLVSWHKD